MSIKRFDTREYIEDDEAGVEFVAVPQGAWVMYSDHAATDEHHRATIQQLRNAIVRADASIRGVTAKTDTADPNLLRALAILADALAFTRETQCGS